MRRIPGNQNGRISLRPMGNLNQLESISQSPASILTERVAFLPIAFSISVNQHLVLVTVEEFEQRSIKLIGAFVLRPVSRLVDENKSRTGHSVMNFIRHGPRTGRIMGRPEKQDRRSELWDLVNQVINRPITRLKDMLKIRLTVNFEPDVDQFIR